ncbi:hypothetical protein EDB80DRAFT_124363 [Ilyonectria destructans]|nr:hypothetical protein EDB80DRAFT_124363 [Ilyonectria destructans]
MHAVFSAFQRPLAGPTIPSLPCFECSTPSMQPGSAPCTLVVLSGLSSVWIVFRLGSLPSGPSSVWTIFRLDQRPNALCLSRVLDVFKTLLLSLAVSTPEAWIAPSSNGHAVVDAGDGAAPKVIRKSPMLRSVNTYTTTTAPSLSLATHATADATLGTTLGTTIPGFLPFTFDVPKGTPGICLYLLRGSSSGSSSSPSFHGRLRSRL